MPIPGSDIQSFPEGLSIGSVAHLAEVAPVTLRYWEKLGLIKARRTSGGHRLYAPELLPLIKKIKDLLKDGKIRASEVIPTPLGKAVVPLQDPEEYLLKPKGDS